MIGEPFCDHPAELSLDRNIYVSDKIDDALFVDLKTVPEAGHLHRPRSEDCLDRGGEEQRVGRHQRGTSESSFVVRCSTFVVLRSIGTKNAEPRTTNVVAL